MTPPILDEIRRVRHAMLVELQRESRQNTTPPLYVDYVLQKNAPIKQITPFMRID